MIQTKNHVFILFSFCSPYNLSDGIRFPIHHSLTGNSHVCSRRLEPAKDIIIAAILNHSFQNYLKIFKKCFFGCEQLTAWILSPQSPVSKGLKSPFFSSSDKVNSTSTKKTHHHLNQYQQQLSRLNWCVLIRDWSSGVMTSPSEVTLLSSALYDRLPEEENLLAS